MKLLGLPAPKGQSQSPKLTAAPCPGTLVAEDSSLDPSVSAPRQRARIRAWSCLPHLP